MHYKHVIPVCPCSPCLCSCGILPLTVYDSVVYLLRLASLFTHAGLPLYYMNTCIWLLFKGTKKDVTFELFIEFFKVSSPNFQFISSPWYLFLLYTSLSISLFVSLSAALSFINIGVSRLQPSALVSMFGMIVLSCLAWCVSWPHSKYSKSQP